MRLMQRIRDSIRNDCFPQFVKKFIKNYYLSPAENVTKLLEKESKNEKDDEKSSEPKIPDWVINALKEVNINVLDD